MWTIKVVIFNLLIILKIELALVRLIMVLDHAAQRQRALPVLVPGKKTRRVCSLRDIAVLFLRLK